MDYAAAVEIFFAPAPDDVATPDVVAAGTPARRLRDAIEPIAMHDVWSASVNAAMAERGLDFFPAYVVGRAAPLGEVPGAVVAATFGVFEPTVIGGMWDEGRAKLSPKEMVALRDRVTGESLRATIGSAASEDAVVAVAEVLERAIDAVDGTGRPLFAALRAQPRLADPYGRLWRATDAVREHRGDSHIIAWVSHGLDPIQANLSTELWWHLPLRSYVRTRGWSEQQIDAAVDDLRDRGLMDGDEFTEQGEALRADIELCTDLQERSIVKTLADDFEELCMILTPMKDKLVAGGAYPVDPTLMTRP